MWKPAATAPLGVWLMTRTAAMPKYATPAMRVTNPLGSPQWVCSGPAGESLVPIQVELTPDLWADADDMPTEDNAVSPETQEAGRKHGFLRDRGLV